MTNAYNLPNEDKRVEIIREISKTIVPFSNFQNTFTFLYKLKMNLTWDVRMHTLYRVYLLEIDK